MVYANHEQNEVPHAMMALTGKDAAVIAALPDFIEKTDDPRELLYVLTTSALCTPDTEISAALHRQLAGADTIDETLKEAGKLALRRQGMTLLTADFSTFPATTKTWYETEILAIIRRLSSGQDRAAITTFSATTPSALRTHIEKILSSPTEIDRTPVEVPPHFIVDRDLYMKACIECHQADGKGVKDTFPPSVGSEWVKGHSDTILRSVLGGLSGPFEIDGQKFNGVMPGHAHVSDEEIANIANIVNFVRFAFGGVKEEPISHAQVKALRPEVEKRKLVPWSIKELEALKP